MNLLRFALLLAATLAVAGCMGSTGGSYSGPPITLIEVHKSERMMFLISDHKLVKSYEIKLGTNPEGDKHFEADGRTPEGAYFITHRNPRSAYHLSLGISYPNDADRAFAKAQGKEPGGDIFIHGENNRGSSEGDWTVGCIAVSDREIEEIYAMVNPGTRINIFP